MIFPIATLVSYISRFMRLTPGDVITTGTPPGVGLGMKLPVFLKAGDVVALGIDGLGSERQIVTTFWRSRTNGTMDAMVAIEKLAKSLITASREGAKISLAAVQAEGLIPATLGEAMAVQRAFAESRAEPVAGWKLAIRADGEAIGAPMFDCVRVGEANAASFPHDGTEGIEVEICFTLSADIPAAAAGPLTRADLIGFIDKVHLGAELLRYRLLEKNQVPFPLFLADRLANHGFVIGPEVDKHIVDVFAGNGENLPQLTVTEGSVSLFDARVKHPNGDPLAPLVAFANAAFNTGEMLKAGNVVTTGSLCGAIPSTLAGETHIALKSVGAFTLSDPRP